MSPVVIDACMMGPLILFDEAADLHQLLIPALQDGRALVPANWHLEVLNLAWMGVRKKRITPEDFDNAMDGICALQVAVDGETNRHAWETTRKFTRVHNLTAYDAAYLELAKRMGTPLLTQDGPLRRAANAEGIALA